MREIKAILKQSGEHVIKDMFGAVSLMFILGLPCIFQAGLDPV